MPTPPEIATFTSPPPLLEAGIYRVLAQRPRLPLAQTSNFWPLTARLYEPLWRQHSVSLLTRRAFSTERELALMLAWLKPQPGELVLDAACSAGLYARTLRKTPGVAVHGVDMSLPFLQQAKRYAEQADTPYTLVQADVCALPYRDRVFDALVCGGSLNEFTDLDAALREFGRVLGPNGRMWQMYLTRAKGVGRLIQGAARLTGLRFIDSQRLERQANRAGLTLVRAQYRGVVALALFVKTEG